MMIANTVTPALKFGLQFLGLWPNVPYSTIYWLNFMFSMLIVQWFQYLYIFEHLNISDLSNLAESLTVTLYYSLTCFKLTSLRIYRRVLHQILIDMDNDWCECSTVGEHLHMMTIKADIAHFITNATLSSVIIVAVLYLSGEYAIRFLFLTEDYNDTLRPFPIKIQFPFDTQQSPLYEFLVVVIFLHVMLHVYTMTILNGLIFTLVLHVSGQIDILCHEFRNISRHTLPNESFLSSLGVLVERHNRIISFSENIDNLFAYIALVQVVWITVLNSCLGLIIIISIYNETSVFVLVKTISGYIVVMIEAFIICFAGEYLSHKSTLIASATYQTLWYNMPTNAGKIILFVIMRSQKQLTITAGKMMDMSFETFANIMKASASYISVLNAIY